MICGKNEVMISEISPDESIFLEKWIANGFNGTKAYAELHEDASYESCRVSASRMLANVSLSKILEIRNIGLEKFLAQLHDGLSANQTDAKGNIIPDHRTRLPYWLALGKMLNVFEKNKEETPDNSRSIIDEIRKELTMKEGEKA
jgi:hypothetical protein